MEQNGQQQPEEGVYYVGESIPQDRQQVLEEDKPGPAVSIEALETEVFLKVETQFYVLLVDYGDRKYEIRRRYSDFEWLFRVQ